MALLALDVFSHPWWGVKHLSPQIPEDLPDSLTQAPDELQFEVDTN